MDKISPIKERIILFLENQGIKKTDFYSTTGIAASNFKGKGLSSEIGGDAIVKILSEYACLNAEWLITGKGEMCVRKKNITDLNDSVMTFNNDKVAEKALREQLIPLYSVEASAGNGSFDTMLNEENIIDRYKVPEFKSVDFMIYVKGSSMYPKYNSGDIIACRILHESKFIQWNKVYVITTREQGFLVKRLKKSEQKNCLLAVSDNATYDPFDIPTDEITGLALVIGVIRLE